MSYQLGLIRSIQAQIMVIERNNDNQFKMGHLIINYYQQCIMLLKKSISNNQGADLDIGNEIEELMDIDVDSVNNNQLKKIMISQVLELLADEMQRDGQHQKQKSIRDESQLLLQQVRMQFKDYHSKKIIAIVKEQDSDSENDDDNDGFSLNDAESRQE